MTGSRPLVLVVEDHPENSRLVEKVLTRSGYDCMIRSDAASGIEAARSLRPALVLMDMSLPGLDGWEATRRLKADSETATVPVVALTAHAMAEDREKALAAGCDEFVTKPFRAAELLAVIRRLVP